MGINQIGVSIRQKGGITMKTKLFFFFLLLAIISFFSGCTQGSLNGPMTGWGHMMGYGYGGMFMWLILIIIAGVIIYFALERSRRSGNSTDASGESPMEILKKRYAKGEITKEEFDRIKKDLES